jgi:hypothetical protein
VLRETITISYQRSSTLLILLKRNGALTPFIAVGLVGLSGGSWHLVAAYLAIGCLLSVIVAAKMKAAKQ